VQALGERARKQDAVDGAAVQEPDRTAVEVRRLAGRDQLFRNSERDREELIELNSRPSPRRTPTPSSQRRNRWTLRKNRLIERPRPAPGECS